MTNFSYLYDFVRTQVKLLGELSPSEIRQDPRWANHVMGRIVSEMGIRPEYRG